MTPLFIRKTPHHFTHLNPSQIIFLTVCTFNRMPILTNQDYHKTLYSIWKESRHWNVGHYLLMPDHLHLFVQSKGKSNEALSHWVTYWKRAFSKIHRFSSNNPFWQKNYWDSNIKGSMSYSQKWLYVQDNPFRKNLILSNKTWPFKGTITHLTKDKSK